MKRLFKEVWRSLFKNNKVVVAGLTILIFLTAGVFTVLNDTYQSMKKQYNYYKDKSKYHDLTVDYNFSANGSAFNNGYYINGLTQNDSRSDYDKPLYYVEVDSQGQPKFKDEYKVINFNNLKNEEYLNLSNFFTTITDKNRFAKKYIKTSDFLTLYSNYNPQKSSLKDQPLLNLEFTPNFHYIILKHKYLINTYSKINGQYVIDEKSRTITPDDKLIFTFDKDYKLSDIVSLSERNDKLYAAQIPLMYINLSYKEPVATFDLLTARKWNTAQNIVYVVDSEIVAKKLGFLQKEDGLYYKQLNSPINTGIINIPGGMTLKDYYDLKLSAAFKYDDIFTSNEITASLPEKFSFNAGTKYNIPTEWTAIQEDYSFYARKNYRITYDGFHKKDWTGTYSSFIESLINTNDFSSDLKDFSLWTKASKTFLKEFNKRGEIQPGKEIVEFETNNAVSYDEANTSKLVLAPESYQLISEETLNNDSFVKISKGDLNYTTSILDFYKLNEPKSIAQIETNDSSLTIKEYKDITNKLIKNERFDYIKNGAVTITKQNIYNKIASKVGGENIGIRQTITIDSFNNDEKYVFHLVNNGDERNAIIGIPINVDKLVSNDNKLHLEENDSINKDLFKSKQIPPFIAVTIIQYAKENISPDPDYIDLDIAYENVIFHNKNTGEKELIKTKKVYKLSKYGYDLVPNFANLGVMWYNNKLVMLHPIFNKNNEIINWENLPLQTNVNGELTIEEFSNLINSPNNMLTLKANIGKDGWTAKSKEFANWIYVPFGWRGPDSEVTQEATNFNTLNKALEKVEKNLLETSLIRDSFLTRDIIYSFQKSFAIAAEKNSFAKIFSEGNVNLNIVPKLILDTLYEMTHDSNGDYLNKFFTTFLTRIKQKIEAHPKEKQKEYLTEQIKKFDAFMKAAIGEISSTPINWGGIVNLSNDPIVVVDNLINIINAIDFRVFTDYSNSFFINKYNRYYDKDDKEVDAEYVKNHKDEIFYQRKLSYDELVLWFLKSIDWEPFKQAILNIINNFNLDLILQFDNPENPLQPVLAILPKQLTEILGQLDAKEDEGHYRNILNGLSNLLISFDLPTFIKVVESKIKVDRFNIKEKILDSVFNTTTEVEKYYIASYLTQADWIYSVLRTFFIAPGSNKSIKNIVIKMFNISSKGTSIKVDKDLYLTVPASDPDKLDYFDLIKLAGVIGNNPQSNDKGSTTEQLNQFAQLDLLINKIKNYDSLDLQSLKKSERRIINTFFGWRTYNDKNELITYSKDEIQAKVNLWSDILKWLRFQDNNTRLTADMSLGNAFEYFENTKDTTSDVLFYSVVQKALNVFDKFTALDNYSYLSSAYGIIEPLWEALEMDATIDEKISFLNDLLALANNDEILKFVNSFELIQPSANNIVSANQTHFGVSRALANPEATAKILFKQNSIGRYENELIYALIKKYPFAADYVQKHQLALTKTFAYIGASEQFNRYSETNIRGYEIKYNNLLSVVLDNLINGMFKSEVINDNFEILNYVLKTNYKIPSLSAIGISDVLINPLLRHKNPQLLVWLLTDTNAIGSVADENSNLAYFINDKLVDFSALFADEQLAYYLLTNGNITRPTNVVAERDYQFYIAIDNDYLVQLQKLVDADPEKYTPFGLNLIDIMIKGMDSITNVSYSSTMVKFNEVNSYLAKANFAWLQKNNKKIYNGTIPNDSIKIQELIKKLPEEYKIDVSGSEYIIIGDDITFDYLYPVIDENNIQVNTKNQAVLFVTQAGFDRMRQAFKGNVVKEYLVVHAPQNDNIHELNALKNELEEIVSVSTNNKNGFQRVYLSTEIDPINPERATRISTTKGIVTSVKLVSLVFLIMLVFLVTVSIIFIIKRYIANKNKVIGILVAQGYTPIQIAISLTTFAFFTIFLGGVLGYFTGFMLHGQAIRLLQAYWTIPIQTLDFSVLSLLINIFVPLIAMSLLIIFISLHSLRYKAIDLMSGVVELNTGEVAQNIIKKLKSRNVKTKFSASLLLNSFGKLVSFSVSVVLASITTVFAFGTFGVFEKSINSTYNNRNYTYKYDLSSPTVENGALNPFYLTKDQLENSLYVPIGNISEAATYANDYFKPGFSNVINQDDKNGNPSIYDGHIVTQFSVNIKVSSAISIDPWQIVYNSLPDTQKSRIIKVRDKVADALQHTQEGIVYEEVTDNNGQKVLSVNGEKTKQNRTSFFYYIPNPDNTMDGKFYYFEWNNLSNKFERQVISTSNKRNEYRDFLVNAYAKVYEDNIKKLELREKATTDAEKEKYNPIYDFFVGFNSLYFNPRVDEGYTYVASNYKDKAIKLYGYNENSKFVKIKDNSGNDLIKYINELYVQNKEGDPIPIVINHVSEALFKLKQNDVFELEVLNNVNRYKNKIQKALYSDYKVPEYKHKFKVVGIIDTYINNEFVIPKEAADRITELNTLNYNPEFSPFNGILSKDNEPQQLIWSTGLYSPSGYNPSTDSFNADELNDNDAKDMFDGIFGGKFISELMPEGNMITNGYKPAQIIKFLNENFDINETDLNKIKHEYELAKDNAKVHIQRFAQIYDDQLYIPTASTIDAKEIEVGYTKSIAATVQIIITIISIICFLVSIIILVIISTLLINENEKNIAIWSILGYNEKEKIKMFFGIYVPFILISLLIAIPLGIWFMFIFSGFLTATAAIAIPLNITFITIGLVVLIVFMVFIITSIISWRNINKVKAIDLLKGK
ncbi:ABC transporter permease [Mycoplasma hafezii]|uniref:ABC transporter permease n=1 Tax=Mycoplasma hafezii TaxID=525886 RepID=UPI003CF1D77E